MPDSALAAPFTLSDLIRQSTREHHKRAEHSDFQQRLVGGKAGAPEYAAWLAQMQLVHRALERLEDAGVRAAGATAWPIARDRYRTEAIAADLAAVGADTAERAPLPATAAFVARCEEWARDPEQAWRLLGAWYVLEGATNGGRYIARNVRRGAGLEGTEGTRYLDPWGEQQQVRWQGFKDGLDAAVPPARHAAVLAGAIETYEAVTAIGEELSAG